MPKGDAVGQGSNGGIMGGLANKIRMGQGSPMMNQNSQNPNGYTPNLNLQMHQPDMNSSAYGNTGFTGMGSPGMGMGMPVMQNAGGQNPASNMMQPNMNPGMGNLEGMNNPNKRNLMGQGDLMQMQ